MKKKQCRQFQTQGLGTKGAAEFSQVADHSTFAVVRSALNPHSPIRCILLVSPPHTLEEVARAMTTKEPVERSRLDAWLNAGVVRFAVPKESRQFCPRPETALSLEDIPGITPCQVLYLSPVYLVALECLPQERGDQ